MKKEFYVYRSINARYWNGRPSQNNVMKMDMKVPATEDDTRVCRQTDPSK